jgi:hypothetical protein
MDEITLRAAMAGRPEEFLVTGRMLLRYHKPVPVGERLHLRGSVRRRRGRTVDAEGQLVVSGEVAVEGDATLFRSPDVDFGTKTLAELGWKVYPD